MPLIERIDLQAITRERAQLTLRYAGDQARLQTALAEQDLALNQQGGVWIRGPAPDGDRRGSSEFRRASWPSISAIARLSDAKTFLVGPGQCRSCRLD